MIMLCSNISWTKKSLSTGTDSHETAWLHKEFTRSIWILAFSNCKSPFPLIKRYFDSAYQENARKSNVLEETRNKSENFEKWSRYHNFRTCLAELLGVGVSSDRNCNETDDVLKSNTVQTEKILI